MRRPLVLVLTFFALGIHIGFHDQKFFLLGVSLLCFICFALPNFLNKKALLSCDSNKDSDSNSNSNSNILLHIDYKFILITAVISLLSGFLWFHISNIQRVELPFSEGDRYSVEGFVRSVKENKSNGFKLEIFDESTKERILVNVYNTDSSLPHEHTDGLPAYYDLAGRKVKVAGEITLPSPGRNPKCFDYRLYLKTKKINYILNADLKNIYIEDDLKVITNKLFTEKKKFILKLEERVGSEKSGLLAGILFGDKHDIDEEVYDDFQKNGTAHILAVSGIHVGIIYGFLLKVFKRKRNIFFNIVIIILLFSYAALAEFSPSVLRATTMIFLLILSRLIHERYDLLSVAAATAILFLIFNPYYLYNIGFQLSFLAVFILSVALPFADRKVERFLKSYSGSEMQEKIIKTLSMIVIPSSAIQIGMIPVTAYFFNYISLSAFFINIIVIFIAGLLIPLGILLIPLSYVSFNVMELCLTGCSLLLDILVSLNSLTSVEGRGFFYIESPSVGFLFAYYFCFFFLLSEISMFPLTTKKAFSFLNAGKRRHYKIALSLCMCIFIVSAIGSSIYDYKNRPDIVFLDVGQGDCLHVRTQSGKNILVDGGGSFNYNIGKKTLLPYLLKNGVSKIDLAIISHMHEDHYKGISELSYFMNIEKLALFEGYAVKEAELLPLFQIHDSGKKRRQEVLYLKKGDKLILDQDVSVDILAPEKKDGNEFLPDDENKLTLVVKVNYKNSSILMTGDIGFEGEDYLLKNYDKKNMLSNGVEETGNLENIHILKVPHHGSKYSSSQNFIEKVNPKAAVIQVGKNKFGHPHASVLEGYRKNGIMVLRNDLHGAISMRYTSSNESFPWKINAEIHGFDDF